MKDKITHLAKIQNESLFDEFLILRARSSALESALKTFIDEAHFRCLDGLTECDHTAGVCFCTYHDALERAQSLLGR